MLSEKSEFRMKVEDRLLKLGQKIQCKKEMALEEKFKEAKSRGKPAFLIYSLPCAHFIVNEIGMRKRR